jgi:acyl carrier protein
MNPPASSSSDSVAATVRAVLTDILGLPADDAALADDANLFELGLDSLGVVRFITEIEAALALELPQEDLRAELFEHLGRLVARIEARASEGAA